MTLVRRASVAGLALAAACTGGSGAPGIGIASGAANVVTIGTDDRKPAPSFEGPSLRPGPRVSGESLGGGVGVVNFWGSWCGPCRREQRGLEALWKEYRTRGVGFIGINVRDQKAAALAYLDEFSVTYPSIYDPSSAVAFRFGVRFMPATYVIDGEGRIAARIIGAVAREEDLRALLDEELAR